MLTVREGDSFIKVPVRARGLDLESVMKEKRQWR
jgi:hypothetical protein